MSDSTQKALLLKEKGVKCFKQRNHAMAVQHFTAAIALDADEITLYSNRSASYGALAKNDAPKFDLAIADAKKCIEMDAKWGKGYARLGAAYFQQGNYEDAVKTYAIGLGVDPSNQNITSGLQAAQKKMAAKAKKEKAAQFNPEDTIIGIDLGTTYSCVGVWKENGVEIIANSLGDRTTPSWVSFLDGDRLVGQSAKNVAASNPSNTVYDIKRCIGQQTTDAGVEKDIARFPFTVRADGNNRPVVHIGEEKFLPEQISALVLAELKKTAEDYLGHEVTKAVITVPAYFNDAQRNATKAAGKIAGLEVKRIINEPTAAALSYGLDSTTEGKQNVCIFDLGGGTFDVSVLSINDGIFEVKATGGDTHLGGEDFDNNIVDYLVKDMQRKNIGDITGNKRALRRLKAAAERAKRTLSNANVVDIEVESLVDGNDYTTKLTRAKFESLNSAFFARTIETVSRVLKDAKLKADEITEVVLVGGSTRIPKIQTDLQKLFNGKELCKALNPDEAVAYGAAVQGGILSGRRNAQTQDLLLMDVTPLSLGIETTGRVMSIVIPRNTAIPCVKQSTYTTEQDYQDSVDISIYEGERMKTEHNNHLGKFTISGIERAKRGEPQIEVTFELNADGILKVKARDAKTGAENKIEIENKQTASQEEIERMIDEAKRFKKEDKERISKVDAMNHIERVIYEVLEASKNQDSKLADVLEQAAMDTQDWLDENGETASSSELKKRAYELERRIQSRK